MIRPAALLLLAAALSAPAAAESITLFHPHDWVTSSSTDYEMVDEAERIFLARAVATLDKDEVRFKIEETVKGETGRWLQARSKASKGALYLLFLNPNEEQQWILSDVGFVEIDAENRDWMRVLRLFAGISALDDEVSEKKALRELREAALANPGRYPKALARMIDLHFGTPTPGKPFSDLMDLYDAAATDIERLAVLRALLHGEHTETADFFRGLLLGGEPLWLMEPVIGWMCASDVGDVPLLKDLVRVWLEHPWEDRASLLRLMLQIAEPEDSPLLWTLLPSANLAEKVDLVEHILGRPSPEDPFVDRLRLPKDEQLNADLFVLSMGQSTSTASLTRLEALLTGDAAHDRQPAASLEELLSAFEASREPAERRGVLMEIFHRVEDKDEELAVLWRLMRQASLREADALLQWAVSVVADEEDIAALYRAASGDEEKNRALWLLLAAWGTQDVRPLLSVAGVLGEGSVRLERVAQAFLTCPNEEVRRDLACHFEDELATPGDFLTMLKVLEGANLTEAQMLAPWFARNPGPEALSLLWRVPIPSLYEAPDLAAALAASGDPEVLDMALDLRRRVTTEDSPWVYRVLARSPLPAAQEEARRILEDGGHAQLQLMWEVAEEDNASPWREWYLQEIADSETVDEATRENALTYLARLSESRP